MAVLMIERHNGRADSVGTSQDLDGLEDRSHNSHQHEDVHRRSSQSASHRDENITHQRSTGGDDIIEREESKIETQPVQRHAEGTVQQMLETAELRPLPNIRPSEGSDAHMQKAHPQMEETNPVRRLSSAKMYELASSPESLPRRSSLTNLGNQFEQSPNRILGSLVQDQHLHHAFENGDSQDASEKRDQATPEKSNISAKYPDVETWQHELTNFESHIQSSRPQLASRTFSTPLSRKRASSQGLGSARTPIHRSIKNVRSTPVPLPIDKTVRKSHKHVVEPSALSPMPSTVPAPPTSLSTYLELELSSNPDPPYVHRSKVNDYPYESSRVKLERLQNFLLLPPQLEQVLWFGALACLDAWLYSFTLLPLRFFKALSILIRSWCCNLAREIEFVARFIYLGSGRLWRRRRKSSITSSPTTAVPSNGVLPQMPENNRKSPSFVFGNGTAVHEQPLTPRSRRNSNAYRHHRRTKSIPSALEVNHKADILKGLLILISCTILMYFDASRMYHGIRGQAAIKLYVIYNVLEVCDRLFSAIGQDVLECLFSTETLERKPDGRSKVFRPLWLFIIALVYNLVHATALFYQVITLNVAVNSYSNALLTLLMSNQFVEIKGTVFKKFEKENLFQLTCADVVERFQLWLMLTIIAARNVIETGGLSLNSGVDSASAVPLQSSSILPKSFSFFPAWTGQVMGPFLLVLGSEMLVDWIKHAYINKFNLIKPAVYGRFLDILAKDYYTNAFADQNLTRRLGLPVIPLSCLFIRASVQTYHMFLATHMPLPIPSTATSLSVDEATTSPATTAALEHIDHIFRRALGRSTFGGGGGSPSLAPTPSWLSTDDLIAFTSMLLFFLVLFLVLLALKLVLGMCLLSFARRRYIGMKEREQDNNLDAGGKRAGGWGVVEVDEPKREWIYADDRSGLEKLRERDKRKGREEESFAGVSRYSMVAKRIW